MLWLENHFSEECEISTVSLIFQKLLIHNFSSFCPCDFNPTGTPSRIDVDSTWILCRYVEDQISTNFHVISAFFFDVVLMVEKSTWFPRTFLDVISMAEKFTWFPRNFFDVISMVEKSTWFLRTFFNVISLV